MPNEVKKSDKTSPNLQYGGQAVIEGVMMRSPRYFAVACRKPDGSIVVQREEVDKSILGKLKWLNVPFLRGTLALIDAMALGSKALAFASKVQLEADQQASANHETPADANVPASEIHTPVTAMPEVTSTEKASPAASANDKINDIKIGGSMAFGLVFGLALFVMLPTALTGGMQKLGLWQASSHRDRYANILDGLIRMAIFFGYIGAISLMPQIRRVFEYHGAEHKAINTLEAGLPLNNGNALSASRIHPRCGTSFIFIVMVINLIVFAFLPRPENFFLRFLLHLAVIPFVAGVSYEIIKLAGQFRRFPIVMAIFAPGMWSQYLTTREPDNSQVEVALAALNSVLEAEGHLELASKGTQAIS